MFARLLVLVFLVLIAGVWTLIQVSREYFAYTSDAYVLTDYVVLSPTVSGRLAKIFVGDNERVAAGDALFEIDQRPYTLALQSAEAAVILAQAAQKGSADALAEAQAGVKVSEAALEDAKTTQERTAALFKQGTVSQQQLDNVTRDLETASADLSSAQAGAVVARDLVVQRQSALEAARATLGLAQYNLGETRVVSPYDGFVAPFTVRAGSYLDVGDAVLAVVDDAAWRIVANLPEEHLDYVAVGQPVWFMVSSRPWRIYSGRVKSIARGIARTPGPVEALPYIEPTTEWIRLSRRFPVEIAIDPAADLPLFMGADARVLIRHPDEAPAPATSAPTAPAARPR